MFNNYFYIWFIGIPVLFFTIEFICKKYNLYQKKTINNNKESSIVSQILTSCMCVTYLGISGIILYKKYNNIIFDKNHLFDKNDDIINHIIIPIILYQSWNTVITIMNKDLYSIYYVLHHIFVIILALMILNNYFQYISIIYFGIIEISNIFLSIIEYSKYEKYIINNKMLYNINNLLFIISFYVLRIILFQYYNFFIYYLIISMYDILFSSKYIIQTITSLVINIVLTYLQCYWGFLIYKEIINKINKIN